MRRTGYATGLALLAAALYALNAPFSKLLLSDIGPTMMAALLYLGAGLGMGLVSLCRKERRARIEGERRYVMAMILLDIAAPICLMLGLSSAAAENVALLLREEFPPLALALAALVLGFFAYGLSILCYVRAQRDLGAAKTGAYYAVAPFVSAVLALLIFQERPGMSFCVAFPVMAVGTYLAATDNPPEG